MKRVLHIINHSPSDSLALQHCLSRVQANDGVLLIESAVYAATAGIHQASLKQALAAGVKIYVLAPDMLIRGFEVGEILTEIQPVDYAGFVELTTHHNPIITWA